MIRDQLIARLKEMGDAPDHQRLVAEVLGIRGAPPELARRLVAQALVIEDRRDTWRAAGERVCADAPATPGVYLLRDAGGEVVYVGKAINIRRRLRAHFAERRWRALKAVMARVVDAEWQEVGSELEALLREAAFIHEWRPSGNVQVAPPDFATRAVPRALIRDVVVVLPSVEPDSVELVAARPDGSWLIQRTRRNGADLAVHASRLKKLFRTSGGAGGESSRGPALAAIVYSWLAGRGVEATRLDPHEVAGAGDLKRRLSSLLADERLFVERLDQR